MKPEEVRRKFYEVFLERKKSESDPIMALPNSATQQILSNSIDLEKKGVIHEKKVGLVDITSSPINHKARHYHPQWTAFQDKILCSSLQTKGLSKTGAEKVCRGESLLQIEDFASLASMKEMTELEAFILSVPYQAQDVLKDFADHAKSLLTEK